MTFATSAASPAQFPHDRMPEVALLGRSNVGKSSLLNALAGERGLARISATPGRTRLVNFFRVSVAGPSEPGGRHFYLSDLPGYGYAKVSKTTRQSWETLVRSYLEDRDCLALCVFLLDARHDLMPGDEALKQYLHSLAVPYVVVATKADKLGRGATIERRRALEIRFGSEPLGILTVSALTQDGIPQLWELICQSAALKARRLSGDHTDAKPRRSHGS